MKDLTNKKFFRLTCIKPAGRTKNGLVVWECRCDCGNIKNICTVKLRTGTKSCGCLKAENLNHRSGKGSINWGGFGDLSLSVYSRLKTSAKLRNYDFEVSMEYLWNLFLEQNKVCALSNRPIYLPLHSRPKDNRSLNKNIWMASLDRIDNDKGYIEGNLRWVCKELNYMKHVMSDEEFFSWINVLYKNKINDSL